MNVTSLISQPNVHICISELTGFNHECLTPLRLHSNRHNVCCWLSQHSQNDLQTMSQTYLRAFQGHLNFLLSELFIICFIGHNVGYVLQCRLLTAVSCTVYLLLLYWNNASTVSVFEVDAHCPHALLIATRQSVLIFWFDMILFRGFKFKMGRHDPRPSFWWDKLRTGRVVPILLIPLQLLVFCSNANISGWPCFSRSIRLRSVPFNWSQFWLSTVNLLLQSLLKATCEQVFSQKLNHHHSWFCLKQRPPDRRDHILSSGHQWSCWHSGKRVIG